MSSHFNKLSPAEAERLAMLAEEAAEIIVEVNKILRHGFESFHPDQPDLSNRMRLTREVNDLQAVCLMMEGDFDHRGAPKMGDILSKKMRYAHHQG